jgi:hypothetical protein
MLERTRTPGLLAIVLGAVLITACDDDVNSVHPPYDLPDEYAFVTTTDFSTGTAAIVSADTLLAPACNLAPIHSDAVARFFQGRIYVVNRFGADNVQVLDPYNGFATMKQFSLGNGSDPHDIALVSFTRAFVTRYNEDQMWIVNPSTGVGSGLISFFELVDPVDDIPDPDFKPEMDHMVRVGDRIFVSVQRLDRTGTLWPPVGKSYLAAFHAGTEQFIDADPSTNGTQALVLDGANPFGEIVYNTDSGMIWVPTAGVFGVNDGGIELVDPVAFTTTGIVITEAQLGGDVTDVVPMDEERGVAVVTDAAFNTMLVRFDLGAPASIDTLYAPGGFVLHDAERSRDGRIFVSDRTVVNPGVRVFNPDTGAQITTGPVDVCLPPGDIVFGRR